MRAALQVRVAPPHTQFTLQLLRCCRRRVRVSVPLCVALISQRSPLNPPLSTTPTTGGGHARGCAGGRRRPGGGHRAGARLAGTPTPPPPPTPTHSRPQTRTVRLFVHPSPHRLCDTFGACRCCWCRGTVATPWRTGTTDAGERGVRAGCGVVARGCETCYKRKIETYIVGFREPEKFFFDGNECASSLYRFRRFSHHRSACPRVTRPLLAADLCMMSQL